MENNHKLIILWGLTIIGMILHFNYHIGGIFYGIDIVKPGYNGKEPNSIFVIRNLFYHLPVIWILVILYAFRRWVKFALLAVSILYFVAHAGHLAGELGKERNPSQISLLIIVLIVAGLLVREHFFAWKQGRRNSVQPDNH